MPKGVPGSGPGAGAGGGGGGVDWLNPVMEALKAITEALTYPGADLGQLAHMQAMLQQIAISARQGGQPGGQPDVMGPGAPPGPPPGMGGAPGPPGGMPGAGMAVP